VILVLCIAFVLSGAAGLIYESIWTRYLGLFMGHDAYAQILVLAIFLGGMSAGAMLTASRSRRLQDPLKGYALVEVMAGLIGFVFHDLFLLVTNWAYDHAFPALGGGTSVLGLKWTLAALLILPQSVLLGATFPLMTAGVLRRVAQQPGRILALLYFANSLGAAVGVLVAGFYLIGAGGLPGTVNTAAGLNVLVAVIAFVVARRIPASLPAAEPEAPATSEGQRRPIHQLLLGVAFGTAIASFVYEIGWIRMLSLVLGSATHSFELMLSAFILGLALGSFWIRQRADRWEDARHALGITQCVMGCLALATVPIYLASFQWTATLLHTFARTPAGYVGFTMARYAICLAVMLPATFCAGITLPLITRAMLVTGAGERAIGQVYGANTLGSIIGAMVAGLILLPLTGLKAMLILGAALDMALGVVLLLRPATPTRIRWAPVAVAVSLVVIAAVAGTQRFDHDLMTSGVYRFGSVPTPGSRQIRFYHDGRTATVAAGQVGNKGEVTFISSNGKPDASLPVGWATGCDGTQARIPLIRDYSTQILLPLIALAFAPNAKNAAVIGQGSGMTSQFLLASPKLEQLVTIEIEPEMIRGSRIFYPANRLVFEDPRSRLVIDDAKSYFASARQRFDLIVSEPSNPWVSGVSGLFTVEFYQRVRGYLGDRGVFGQWLHLYEINDELVLSVLAALHRTFPWYQVFLVSGADMLIVASMDPLPAPDWSIFRLPRVEEGLCTSVPFTPRMLEATRLANQQALGPLLDRWGTINSDFYPALDLGAEQTRYLGLTANGFNRLSSDRLDLAGLIEDRRSLPTEETVSPVPAIPRTEALATAALLRDPRRFTAMDTVVTDEALAGAIDLVSQWRGTLASGQPPTNWRIWLEAMGDVEARVAGGTSGVADQAFYADARRYLDRFKAPAGVRDAVEFRRALAAWDFSAAAEAGERLSQAALQKTSWIPPDEVMDGLVMARIKSGDPAGADRALRALAPLSRQAPESLRLLLLTSYVLQATSHP